MSKRMIIAVWDNKAGDILGNYVQLHRHVATAIRMFGDALNDDQTPMHKHYEDYDLVQLGEIGDDGQIIVTSEEQGQVGYIQREIIITGQAMMEAMQAPATKTVKDTIPHNKLGPRTERELRQMQEGR